MEINEKEKIKSEEGEKNRILFFGVFFAGVFLLCIGYLCFFMIFRKETIVSNPYNATRQAILESRVVRGTIEAEDGTRIAYTANDENGNEVRVYPYRNLFAHVIGYNTNGRLGIEYSENYYLVQTHDSISDKIQNDLNNRKNKGDTVTTSLNVELQKAAYNALGVYRGAIIVTEPSTGKILAMVSKPDFDPNEIKNIWDEAINDEESTIFLNRALNGQYAPGSTFKIFTTIEYLTENPDTFDKYSFNCNGVYKAGDESIHCYGHSSHGKLDLYQSFARSCNSSFANLGMTLDRDKFGENLTELLFNSNLPTSLSCSKSKISMGNFLSDHDVLQEVIGQGKITITPMHLNMITMAIANGGILMEPYVVTGVRGSDESIVKENKPVTYGRLFSEDIADTMTLLMKGVCEYGTAKTLKNDDYTVCGKTGSAEYGETEDASHKGMLDSHSWFTCFAPAENPEIAVTVIVEDMGSGGDYAVPVARQVLDAYFGEN